MKLKFHDMENGSKSEVSVLSRQDLKLFLDEQCKKEPFIGKFSCKHGHNLEMGLGPVVCSIQHVNKNRMPPYLMAKTKALSVHGEYEFLLGGTPTPVDDWLCVNRSEAEDIIWHYIQTGEAHPGYEWEEQ